MLEKTNDVERALAKGCFLSALSLALTFPDICGRIKFPEDKVGTRYKKWFNAYVYERYGEYKDSYKGTEFDGQACYELRCKFLHEGRVDLNEKTSIDKFDLCVTTTIDTESYVSFYGTRRTKDTTTRHIRLDVRELCKNLCLATVDFYNTRNKSLFIDSFIEIIDIEEYNKKFREMNS